jgi:hypothetical protein
MIKKGDSAVTVHDVAVVLAAAVEEKAIVLATTNAAGSASVPILGANGYCAYTVDSRWTLNTDPTTAKDWSLNDPRHDLAKFALGVHHPSPSCAGNEVKRQRTLDNLHILDTAPTQSFDLVTELLADAGGFPINIIRCVVQLQPFDYMPFRCVSPDT